MYSGTLALGQTDTPATNTYLDNVNLNIQAGILDIDNGNVTDVLKINNFTSTNAAYLNFDANLATNTNDQIIATYASGILNVNQLNITANSTVASSTLTLFRNQVAPTLTAFKAYTNTYEYDFTPNAIAGVYSYTRLGIVGGLNAAVANATNPRSYSALADETVTGNLGPMGGAGSTLTIYGNGFNIIGTNTPTNYSGISVASAQTLNIDDVGSLNPNGTVNKSWNNFLSTDGAVVNNAGTTSIQNSVFANNIATDKGGVIYNTNIFSSSGSTYSANSAISGGAIYNSGTANLDTDTYMGNQATSGGAIYNDTSGTITSTDTTLKNNIATDGGAVYNVGHYNSNGETYTSNTATGNGGGIYNNGGILSLVDVTFTGNQATGTSSKGGAIYSNGGSINIYATDKDSTFSGNTENGIGNDIYMTNTTLNLTANDYNITFNGGIEGNGTIYKLGAGNLVINANSGSFTGTYNNSEGGVIIKNTFFSGTNNFTGGTAEIQTGGNLTLNTGDSWTNTNISNSGGTLTLDNFSNTAGGAYTQTLGSLILSNTGIASSLVLGVGSSITGGTVDFTGTGNTLQLSTGSILGADTLITLNTNNTLLVSGGTATINNNDNWSGNGIINITGGNLILDTVLTNGIYTQSGGNTNLENSSILTLANNDSLGGGTLTASGILNLSNTTQKTVSTQILGSGTINKNNTGETIFTADNSGFTGLYTQTIGTTTIQNNFFSGINNLQEGNINIQTNGSLTLNSGDSWVNTNILNSNGSLSLESFLHTGGGTYRQTGGSLILNNTGTASSLVLGTGSTISGGAVGFLNNDNTLEFSTGSILEANAAVTLETDNTLLVSGGDVTMNNNDSWSGLGTVSITNGLLTLDNITTHGTYNQTGGTTNLNSNSTLTLTNDDNLGGGIFNANGILNFSNTDIKTVSTKINGNGTINKNEAGTYIFTADNSGFIGNYNQSNGDIIIQNKFFSGINNFQEGNVDIQTNGNLILNSGDNWINTTILNSNGSLSLESFSHTSGGTYNQTGGTLTLSNTGTASYLALGLGSSISGGTINFSGTGNTLEIATNATLGENAIVNLNTNNTLLVSGGTAIINGNDSWSNQGKINLTSGVLTLNGITTNGIYTQTTGNGSLHLTGGTTLSIGENSRMTAGTIDYIGTGNTLDITTGGYFGPDIAINILENNLFKVSGGEAVFNGVGPGVGTWAGNVELASGTLTINDLTHNAITSGSYTQHGGILNLIDGASLTLNSTSITSGDVNISSSTENKSILDLVYSADTNYNTHVNLNGNGELIIDTNGHTVTNTSDTLITNTGSGNTLTKNGLGTYNFNLSGISGDKQIDYGFNINQGTIAITGVNSGALTLSNNINFGSSTTNGTLELNAPNTRVINLNSSISSSSILNAININPTGTGTVNINSAITGTSINVSNGTVNFRENLALTGDKLTLSGGTTNFINQNFNTTNDITLSGGTMNINAGNGSSSYINDKIIGSPTSVINLNQTVGTAPTDGTIYVNNTISGNNTVNLYNGTMALAVDNYIDGNNFNMSNGILNTQNGLAGTMAFGNLAFTGSPNWLMDVNLANGIADKIISSGTVSGNLNINSIKVLSDSSSTSTSVLVADSSTKGHLSTSVSNVSGALYNYNVSYNGGAGALNFIRAGFSPNAIPANVAQTQTFLLQTAVDNQFFANLESFMLFPLAQRESTICCSLANGNTTGGACPITGNGTFSPIYLCDLNKGVWMKTFTSFEDIPIKNGPDVSTIQYGTLVGGDTNFKYLKHGFVGNTSGFVGYLGSNQNYNRVGVYQNGVILGIAENIVKGNNYATIIADVGGSLGEANTQWGNNNFKSYYAGGAVKVGHNFEFKNGDYIIQPNVMLAYTYTYTPTYNSAGGYKITSKPLNAGQVAPGIRLIKNFKEEKGQIYLLGSFVYNVLDKTSFSADGLELPQLSISPYIEYGVGYQRVWKERLTGFFQTVLRGGGRNGIAFQFGLRWAI